MTASDIKKQELYMNRHLHPHNNSYTNQSAIQTSQSSTAKTSPTHTRLYPSPQPLRTFTLPFISVSLLRHGFPRRSQAARQRVSGHAKIASSLCMGRSR